MLEHIPTIVKEDVESLVEQELKNMESQAFDLIDQLDKNNPNLAKAIRAVAQSTAKKTFVDDYWRKKVEPKFTEAILVIIGIIDQASEVKGAGGQGTVEHSLAS